MESADVGNIRDRLEAEETGSAEVEFYASTLKQLEDMNTDIMQMHMASLKQRMALLHVKMNQVAMLEQLNFLTQKVEDTLKSIDNVD